MITDTQFRELLLELREIRLALQSRQTSLASQAPAPAKTSTSTQTPDSLPLPSVLIENAGGIAVHFGKNAGTPISQLNDKQLLWYGADREPQLKNDGTPFAPRQQDTTLKNACRTVWHQRQGSIPTPAPKPAPAQSTELADEEVPF
jgi:hypothetical protein